VVDGVALKTERLRLLKGVETDTAAAAVAPLTSRLEAMKVLTLALFRELNALEESTHTLRASHINLYDEVERFETDLICSALIRTSGCQRRAARLLGMKVTTLNGKIKRYRIRPDEVVRNGCGFAS
jgi:transcriptional regulator with GAF, ATPase, and Fis domain